MTRAIISFKLIRKVSKDEVKRLLNLSQHVNSGEFLLPDIMCFETKPNTYFDNSNRVLRKYSLRLQFNEAKKCTDELWEVSLIIEYLHSGTWVHKLESKDKSVIEVLAYNKICFEEFKIWDWYFREAYIEEV